MKLTQFYTVLCTDDVARTAAFWQRHFRFKPAFVSDWYVHLVSDVSPAANLAILDYRHETIPAPFRHKASGVLVNLEVEDVDAEYEKAIASGLRIHLTLRDEPFGQRHFITEDPNGIAIDVIKPIPPTAEFLKQYAPDSLPR
ncbi:MAG: VOC family protein [Enhydrobacter sp.]|nr:MAG: VOC family protein [Enhydrobacter sp.]